MLTLRNVIVLLIALCVPALQQARADDGSLASASPHDIVVGLATAVTSGNADPVRAWLTPKANRDLAALIAAEKAGGRLRRLETPVTSVVVSRTEQKDGTTLAVDLLYTAGPTHWTIVFEDDRGLIDHVELDMPAGLPPPVAVQRPAVPRPRAPRPTAGHFAARVASHRRPPQVDADLVPPAASEAGAAVPADAQASIRADNPIRNTEPPPVRPSAPNDIALPLPSPAPWISIRQASAEAPYGPGDASPGTRVAEPASASPADPRAVEFLLATTRKADSTGPLRFTADRGDGLLYGTVRVHIPIDHKEGHVERPWRLGLGGLTLYEEKLDEKKHFVVSGARLLSEAEFYAFATADPRKEALIFVHGFNNSFEDSAYRFAQILFDLQYDKPAILFSWASKGSVVDYLYDKESAEIARDRFAQLVQTLQSQGVEKINVIAHSMGNYLAVAALADSADTAHPDHVDQLIMAAPDIGRDYLAQEISKLARVAHGMTLYACATDRALQASKDAAGGVPRAGDVPPDGPLVLPGVDTIDVSALGQDWFGLNHDVFATNRSVMDDIFSLLKDERHPPRLSQVRGMPDGVLPSRFWRFQP